MIKKKKKKNHLEGFLRNPMPRATSRDAHVTMYQIWGGVQAFVGLKDTQVILMCVQD